MEDGRLLTIVQAAERLALGRSKVYELIQRGELGTVSIGRARRVPLSILEDYIRRLIAEQGDGGKR